MKFNRLMNVAHGYHRSLCRVGGLKSSILSINAKVTGFYAMPKFHMLTYQTEMLSDTKQEFAKDCKAHADRFR
jgi:hypothetical protein